MGVSSIFGPQSNSISSHVQSICDTMEIPHLEMRWDYRIRRENCLVNLYPHPSILSKVNHSPIIASHHLDASALWILNGFSFVLTGLRGHRRCMGLEELYNHLRNKWWLVTFARAIESATSLKAPDNSASTVQPIEWLPVLNIRNNRDETLTNYNKPFGFSRPLLKQIKNSGVAHIVLDCSTEKIYDVLKQSQQIGMISDYHR